MLQPSTDEVLRVAAQWAIGHPMAIILASTTGRTAKKLLSLIEGHPIKLIVITHDPKRTYKEIRFDPDTKERLMDSGHTYLEDHSPWLPRISISRLFEKVSGVCFIGSRERKWVQDYGVGGKVCFMIVEKAFRAGHIKVNEPVISVAGSREGVDTSLILKVVDDRKGAVSIVHQQTLSAIPGQMVRDSISGSPN